MAFKKSIVSSYKTGQVTLQVEDEKLIIHERENVQPILDQAKRLREENHQVGARVGSQNHLRHVAEVPMSVYNRSIREKWGKKEWRQWANDPDNACLRVTQGRI